MDAKLKPIFDKRIFWDVNFEQIDYDAKANFVIERVANSINKPLVANEGHPGFSGTKGMVNIATEI